MRSRHADKAEKAAKARVRAKRAEKRLAEQAVRANERRLIDETISKPFQALMEVPGVRPIVRTVLKEGLARGISPEAALVHADGVLDAESREPGLGLSVFRDLGNADHVFADMESEQGQERCKDFFRRFARYRGARIEDCLRNFFHDMNPDEVIQELSEALPGLLCSKPPPTGERRAQ